MLMIGISGKRYYPSKVLIPNNYCENSKPRKVTSQLLTKPKRNSLLMSTNVAKTWLTLNNETLHLFWRRKFMTYWRKLLNARIFQANIVTEPKNHLIHYWTSTTTLYLMINDLQERQNRKLTIQIYKMVVSLARIKKVRKTVKPQQPRKVLNQMFLRMRRLKNMKMMSKFKKIRGSLRYHNSWLRQIFQN